jgi:hypothetical protein
MSAFQLSKNHDNRIDIHCVRDGFSYLLCTPVFQYAVYEIFHNSYVGCPNSTTAMVLEYTQCQLSNKPIITLIPWIPVAFQIILHTMFLTAVFDAFHLFTYKVLAHRSQINEIFFAFYPLKFEPITSLSHSYDRNTTW